MNLKGKIVTLRGIEEEDLEMLREIINDPDIENLVVGWSLPVSKLQQKKWYEGAMCNQNNLRLIIETKEDGPVGLVILVNIDWKNRVGTYGIKIGNKKFRAKGIGTDATMTLNRYAFDELQLNRIEGDFMDSNEVSKKLYFEKLGWKEEGVKRKAVYKNGQYHDLVFGSILREDYYELLKKNNYWDDKNG